MFNLLNLSDSENFAISLETSQRNKIHNNQFHTISLPNLQDLKDVEKKNASFIIKKRCGFTNVYNCHGLNFASRRTRVFLSSDVQTILSDDQYKVISQDDLLPGDTALYIDGSNEIIHSGLVIAKTYGDFPIPLILSKWGAGGEYLHTLTNVPDEYRKSGTRHEFRRVIYAH